MSETLNKSRSYVREVIQRFSTTLININTDHLGVGIYYLMLGGINIKKLSEYVTKSFNEHLGQPDNV